MSLLLQKLFFLLFLTTVLGQAADEVSGCGNFTLTAYSGQITLPSDEYVENLRCTWTIAPPAGSGSSAVVGFMFFFDYFSLDPDGDSLGFYDGSSPTVPLVTRVIDDSSSVELDYPTALLVFVSDAVRTDDTALGFQLSYAAILQGDVGDVPTPTPTATPSPTPSPTPGCDFTLTSYSGEISLSGDEYVENLRCTWTIAPPAGSGSGTVVGFMFFFDFLSLDADADYLSFYDGAAPPIVPRATRVINDTRSVELDNPTALLVFFSDAVRTNPEAVGFKLAYAAILLGDSPTPTPTATPSPTPLVPSPTPFLYSGCGSSGSVPQSSAQIWIYDVDYLTDLDCTWTLSPSDSTRTISSIYVVFDLIDIEDGDFIEFFDASDLTNPLAVRSGSDESPLQVTATSIVVHFHSDFIRVDDAALGFKLTFYTIYEYDCTTATSIPWTPSGITTWSFGVGSAAVDAVRNGQRTRKLILRASYAFVDDVRVNISTAGTFDGIFNIYNSSCPYSSSDQVGDADLRLNFDPTPYYLKVTRTTELFIVVEAIAWSETSSFNISLVGNAGSIQEDPHVKSWDGVAHTVKGEGDYLLVTSSSLGLTVHGRFCKSARGPWASWTCAIAVRCLPSAQVIEVHALNFEAADSTSATAVSSALKTITCPDVLELQLMRHRFHRHSYLNVRVNRLSKAPADIRGLIGTPNGDQSDDLQHRSGELFAAPAGMTHFIGHNLPALDAVHNSWLVGPAERIFSTPFRPIIGASTQLAITTQKARKSAQAAERRCKAAELETEVDVAICVYDRLAVGHEQGAANLAKFLRVRPGLVVA